MFSRSSESEADPNKVAAATLATRASLFGLELERFLDKAESCNDAYDAQGDGVDKDDDDDDNKDEKEEDLMKSDANGFCLLRMDVPW